MGAPSQRVVLDSNVLVSALIFRDSRHLPLRDAWQRGALQLLLSVATWRELRRVLGYPQFALDDDGISAALAQLGPHIEWVNVDEMAVAALPRCSDRDDQKFLEVAHCGAAVALLTYDRALLKLRRRLAFPVVTPEQWHAGQT